MTLWSAGLDIIPIWLDTCAYTPKWSYFIMILWEFQLIAYNHIFISITPRSTIAIIIYRYVLNIRLVTNYFFFLSKISEKKLFLIKLRSIQWPWYRTCVECTECILLIFNMTYNTLITSLSDTFAIIKRNILRIPCRQFKTMMLSVSTVNTERNN